MFRIADCLQIISLILTMFYVTATFCLVKENKNLRKESKMPFILFDIDVSETPIYYFVIKNIGNGPAKDIKFQIEPDIPYFKDGNIKLSEIPLFKNIKYLPPNKEIKFAFGYARNEIEGKKLYEYKFNIKIEYIDIFNKNHLNEYEIDLTKYKDLFYWKKHDIDEIYQVIEKIEKDFKDLTNYMKDILEYGLNIVPPLNYNELVNLNDNQQQIFKNDLLILKSVLEIIINNINEYSRDSKTLMVPFPNSFELLSLLKKLTIKLKYYSKVIDKVSSYEIENLSNDLFNLSNGLFIKYDDVDSLINKIDKIYTNL